MRNEFSTFDIVKALGIPRERLKDWMNNGFVKPTIPAEGQGTKAVFTREDIYFVAMFHRLLRIGSKRGMAAWLIDHFKKTSKKKISEIYSIMFTIYFRSDGEAKMEMNVQHGLFSYFVPQKLDRLSGASKWDYLHIINIERLRDEVDSNLLELD